MTGRRLLDKQRTRDRIAAVATTKFIERGFDAVTVAEIAAAAGVSKVTVFAHFARKEDLMLDRAPQAEALLVGAVRDRAPGVSPTQALRTVAVRLSDERHPLSGLNGGNDPFLRTVLASPSLIARTRELGDELEQALTVALSAEPDPVPEPRLLAALIVATCRTLVTDSVRQLSDGQPIDQVSDDHRRRLDRAFDALDAAADVLGG